jgi:transcription termination factor NusB
MIDRSELEEMVASSPYGTTFIVPTITGEGSFWSFIIHDSVEIVKSIDGIADETGSVDGRSETRCAALMASDYDTARVVVVAFLFKFETDPPEVYSAFMNPMDQYVEELLDDLARQDRLVIEFFDEKQICSVTCENKLRDSIRATLASLADLSPFTEDAFDLAIDELLSEQPDPVLMWERLDQDEKGTDR